MRPGKASLILRVAITVLVLVFLWHLADGEAALRRLAGAEPGLLLAAMLALIAQTVFSALRWRLTAAQLGLHFDRRTALREYVLSQVVNQILPGGVLGDANRALRSRTSAGLMPAAQAVVFERLAGQLGLLVVLLTGLAFSAVSGPVWPVWLWVTVAGTVLAVPILLVMLNTLPGLSALQRQAAAFARATFARPVIAPQITLSLATALCNVAGFVLCALAVGVTLPLSGFLVLVPLCLLAMLLPLSVSGWGLREGAAAALFPLAGASATDGLTASIAFGLVFLASTLPGLVWLALSNTRLTPNSCPTVLMTGMKHPNDSADP